VNSEYKKSILLVEDDTIVAMMEKLELESHGYTVHHVTTGEEAVKIIHDLIFPVDLILMDIDLGDGIDGAQAAERILAHKDIPVVFLSSHIEPEVVDKTEKITSYGYIVKNTGFVVLDASVKMALKLFAEKIERQRAVDAKHLNEERLEALMTLNNMTGASERELTHFAMEAAVSLTGSTIGYIAFMNENETVLTMYAWSARAMRECAVDNKPIVYPVASTGLWGDAVRQRKAVITNDYAAPNPLKKGIPAGHVRVTRHMNAPTFDEGRIVIVAGVGNKPADYGDDDVRQLSLLMSGLWSIIRRRRSEEALEQERNLYKDLAASQPAGVYRLRIMAQKSWSESEWVGKVESNYKLELVSDLFCEILGATREQCEANAAIVVESILPEDRAGFVARNVVALETLKPFVWEGRLLNGKQKITWVYFASVPRRLDNGDVIWTGILLDVTGRKLAEESLRVSEDWYHAIYDASPLAIVVWDRERRVVDWNRQAELIFGWTREEILGKDFFTFLLPDSALPGVAGVVDELLAGRLPSKVINENCTKDGKIIICEWNNSIQRDVNNELTGVISLALDITGRKMAEEEIQRQLEEKEILLREVHHRLKNNIASVEGLLSLQARSAVSQETRAALQDSIARLQSARILYDKLLLTKEFNEVSFKSYVEGLIDTIAAVCDVEMRVTVNKHIIDFTIASRKAITAGIIINELLTNVFKYAFTGRDNGAVSISIDKIENKATLVIQDNGIGIDEIKLLNKSAGLGLTIVKMLVAQLKGSYSVKIDNGTTSVVDFEI
jgi:PAS domain S-box-containing protein